MNTVENLVDLGLDSDSTPSPAGGSVSNFLADGDTAANVVDENLKKTLEAEFASSGSTAYVTGERPRTAWSDASAEFEDVAQYGIIEVSGSDLQGRPVIVVSACKLPSNHVLDQGKFLRYLKHTLDKVVESDYSLVYLHHGLNSKNKPSMSFVKDAYKEFDRKYKKNIKAFYIVHPTYFIRVLMGLFKPLLSLKFGRKIRYVNRLSELKDPIQVSQLVIPPEVTKHDMELANKSSSQQNQRDASESSVPVGDIPTQQFGVSLKFLEDNNPGYKVPKVMQETISYIRENGLTTQGIFRRSAAATALREVQNSYNLGKPVVFEEPHLAAVTLKAFLRQLPEPLLTFALYEYILNISRVDEDTRFRVISELMQKLPPRNFLTLKTLILFLAEVVANSKDNLMDASNLAVVFGPNLVWSTDVASLVAMGPINTFVRLLLDYHKELFLEDSEC